MAAFNFSWLSNGVNYVFNPVTDRMTFDDTRISAATVFFDYQSFPTSNTYFTSFIENKEIGLASAPRTITSNNVRFADGSKLLVGDNTTGTVNDDAGNTLTGGTGDDQLVGLGGNDKLTGGAGDDFVVGGEGNDTLNGGDGVDFLFDLEGSNRFSGGAGNDFIFALGFDGGSNLAYGGTGRDTYYVSFSFSLGPPTSYTVQDFATGAGGDLVNIASLLYASAISGYYSGGDPFAGGYVNVVQSGSSALVMTDMDGPGSTFGMTTALTLANTNATAARATVTGYVLGGAGNDALTGNDSNQTLFAAAGNDTVNGGKGSDNMFGGSGSDTYYVDDRGDTVNESSNESLLALPGGLVLGPGYGESEAGVSGIVDTVLAAVTYSLETIAFVENLRLTGTVAKEATGNALNNLLNGNSGHNFLQGLGGNDTLIGGAGDDTLYGGDGDDVLVLDVGSETWWDTGGIDTLMTDASRALTADDFMENITLTGTAASAGGNDFNNVLTGNNVVNSLNGKGGDDTLDGKGGADNVNGGAGNDTLVWGAGDTLNGSTGTDTLRIAAGNLYLTALADAMTLGIERIDMIGGGNNLLKLAKADVLALSTDTNTITVLGNAGDKVDIVGSFTAGAESGGFRTYALGSGALLSVETDVQVI